MQGAITVLSSEYLIIEQLLFVALRISVNMIKMLGPPTVPCEHPVCIAVYCVLVFEGVVCC